MKMNIGKQPQPQATQQDFERDFNQAMNDALEGVRVRCDSSIYIKSRLNDIMLKVSFGSLGVSYETYDEMFSMTFSSQALGTQQKVIDLLLSVTPEWLFPPNTMPIENGRTNYLSLVKILCDHKKEMDKVIIPLQNKVLAELQDKYKAKAKLIV
jgi:hypothetical protein